MSNVPPMSLLWSACGGSGALPLLELRLQGCRDLASSGKVTSSRHWKAPARRQQNWAAELGSKTGQQNWAASKEVKWKGKIIMSRTVIRTKENDRLARRFYGRGYVCEPDKRQQRPWGGQKERDGKRASITTTQAGSRKAKKEREKEKENAI